MVLISLTVCPITRKIAELTFDQNKESRAACLPLLRLNQNIQREKSGPGEEG
jgi:hypothetical protein